MIALLAAVAEETSLIRQALLAERHETANGTTFTFGKLSGHDICLAHSGIGKAAAAATAITLLCHCRPRALLLFGCGGAYPGCGLTIGDLALASAETFADEGFTTHTGFHDLLAMKIPMRRNPEAFFNTWPVDQHLHEWARPLLAEHAVRTGTALHSGLFATVSTCTGTTALARAIESRTGAICENMEGAGVALACRQLAVPLLELRGISNLVEDRDTGRWDLALGMAAAQQAVLALIRQWPGTAA